MLGAWPHSFQSIPTLLHAHSLQDTLFKVSGPELAQYLSRPYKVPDTVWGPGGSTPNKADGPVLTEVFPAGEVDVKAECELW